jgi:hypothetical protein
VSQSIDLHGAEIEFDSDNELVFNFPRDTSFFYLTERETKELRDFLNKVVTPSVSGEA